MRGGYCGSKGHGTDRLVGLLDRGAETPGAEEGGTQDKHGGSQFSTEGRDLNVH